MTKKVIFSLFVIILLFYSVDLDAGEKHSRKDPLLAGVLSWYMPGLGQFYAGKYLKGSIFWVVENTLFVSTILTVADIHFSVDKDVGFQLNIKPKEKLSTRQKTIAISLAISYVAFHIYNVVDAIQTTKNVNAESLEKKEQSRLNFDYKYVADNNYYMMNYKF